MTEQVNTKQSEFLLIDDEKNTPNLKGAQEFVGGYVECITFPNGDLLIINEEGKLMNFPLNPEATTLTLADQDGKGLYLTADDDNPGIPYTQGKLLIILRGYDQSWGF